MVAIFSKCGNNCTLCPSYKDNLLTDADRGNCSQGWYTYHGFHLSPGKLIACDGCQPVGGNGTRYINCLLRRCALHNAVETCAHCAAYPCETLISRVLGEEWAADLLDRLGEIPGDDYLVYIEPYLSLPHLESIRESLDPGEIVNIIPVSLKPRLAAYPQELVSAKALQAVYELIQEMNTPCIGLSYAQAEVQKGMRSHLLKILWCFGGFGEFEEEGNALLLDHKIYLAQKIHSSHDRVQGYFETLGGYGVHCKVIPINEDRWLTPTGALRRQGARDPSPPWVMKMSFDDRIGGGETLSALQAYSTALMDAYGKTAYRRFVRADFSVMLDG